MKLDNIFLDIIEEANVPALRTAQAKPIVDAIKSRNRITFYYTGPKTPKKTSVKPGYRIKAEPVAIGLNKNGYLVVRAYIDAPSASKRGTPSEVGKVKANYGWRTFRVGRMSAVKLLKNETFDTPREKYNGGGNDGSFTKTYVSADFSNVPEKPIEPAKPTPPPKPKSIVKQTRNIDKELKAADDELGIVTNDLKSNLENIKNNPKDTPDYEKYIEIGRQLTQKKKDLVKKIDDLITSIGQNGEFDKTNFNKFARNYSVAKKTPELSVPKPVNKPSRIPNQPAPELNVPKPVNKPPKTPKQSTPEPTPTPEPTVEPTNTSSLPQPKKKTKPSSSPEDEDNNLNESIIKRIKTLFNKLNDN